MGMTDALTALFSALTPLWEMSLTGAYVAGIVFFLRLLLKGRAPRQAVCLLWLLVFARLLFPFSLESPFSAVPQAITQVPASSAAPAEPGQTGILVQPGETADAPGAAQPAQPGTAVDPAIPGGTAQVPGQNVGESPAPFPWQALAAGVWLAGTLAMLGYALISWLLLRRRLFDAVRAEAGVWEHPAVTSPFLLGIFRPRIYLPAHLPAKNRFFILCHEQTHLRRGDHMVKPVCWLALSLHWFNPMAWLAFLLLSRDLEAACDEAVLRRLGLKYKADYSAALLSCATGGKFPAPCPLAFGGNNAKDRIKSVLHYKKPAFWVLLLAAAAVVIAAAVLLTDPMAEQADPDAEATDSVSPAASPEPAVTLPAGAELLFENQEDGLAVYRTDGASPIAYLVSGQQVLKLSDWYSVTTVTDLRLTDLDGDGAQELAVTSRVHAGAGSQDELRVLEQTDGQWDADNICALLASGDEAFSISAGSILDTAVFTHEPGSTSVTVTTSPGLEATFPILYEELAQRQGTYYVSLSGSTSPIFWWGGVPYARLARYVEFQPDPGEEGLYIAGCVELLTRLDYSSDGSFVLTPVALYSGCPQLSNEPSGGLITAFDDYYGTIDFADSLNLIDCQFNRQGLGIFLYTAPNGQTILRSGDKIGPVSPDAFPQTQVGFSMALTSVSGVYDGDSPQLSFSSVLAGFHNIVTLGWDAQAGQWIATDTEQGRIVTDLVTSDEDLPSDPTRYYLAAELPEEHIYLYSRNRGAETVVVWENFCRSVNRRLHAMPYTPPLLNYTGGSSTRLGDLWVIAQQFISARGDGSQELVVYRLDFEVFGRDCAYDWRACEQAADFFANHTLTYHAGGNTFTLTCDGQESTTGRMPSPRGDIVLEEGRTTALSPDTVFVNYAFNEDDSVTVTLQARPLDEEVDGEFFWYPLYEISWDITFADGQFHTVPGTFAVSPLY